MNLFLTFLFMFTQNLLLALYPVVRDFRPYKRISGHDIRGTPQQIQKDLEASLQSRIAYGSPASIEEFPYFASLQDCGAVIISDRWVLTAAHCLEGVSRTNHSLWVGGESIEKSFEVTYDKIVIHPWYYHVETMVMNDVALLRLTESLEFSKKIRPIELYDEDLDRYDENDSNENDNHKLYYLHDYIDYPFNSNTVDYYPEQASDEHARNYVDSYAHSHEDDSYSHSDEDASHITFTSHSDESNSHGFDRLRLRAEEKNRLVLVARGLDENDQLPENISTMEMFYYPAEACYAKFYSTAYWYAKPFLPLINRMFLCGVRAEDLIGTGLGDSGSPVVKGNKLVGLVSHSRTYEATHSRVVFLTNVASYIPWIKTVTGL